MLSACKKEVIPYDKEESLVTDTATMIMEVNFIGYTSTQIDLEISMLVFNDLASEQDYSGNVFFDNDIVDELNLTFTPGTMVNTPEPEYSSVFLINQNNLGWYEQHHVGIYLRRFLEQIEDDPGRQIALASFSTNIDDKLNFYQEYPGSNFGNSSEFNVNQFYALTNFDGDVNTFDPTSAVSFTLRLNEVIDELIASNELVGDKSITVFTDYDFSTGADATLDMNLTISKANAEGISINFLGPNIDRNITRIAFETGGFICQTTEQYEEHFGIVYGEERPEILVFMENLNNLLSKNISIHSTAVQITNTSGGLFGPGENRGINFSYNDKPFYIQLLLP